MIGVTTANITISLVMTTTVQRQRHNDDDDDTDNINNDGDEDDDDENGGDCWRKRSGQSRCLLRPLTHASVNRAYQAESVGRNSFSSILIAIRRSPNL